MRLNKLITIGFFILTFSLVPIANVTASTWLFYDAIDDVTFTNNGVDQDTGDYQDEVDIVSIELDASDFVITFQDVPQDDHDHQYYLHVFWTLTPVVNRTDGYFGIEENMVWTYLHNSTHHLVVDNQESGGIHIIGNTIQMPIPDFALIENTTNPEYIEMSSVVYTGTNQYYFDKSNTTLFTTAPTGFDSLTATITSLSALMIICVIISSKKKKR